MVAEHQPATARVLQWVARQVHPHGRVLSARPLPGGISAHMDLITVRSPAGVHDVVLRRWPDDDLPEERRPAEPSSSQLWSNELVARECAALTAVHGRGIPAPELLAADPHGAESGARCTLTTALVGQPELSPADLPSWLEQLAVAQAAIHTVPARLPTRPGPEPGARGRSLDWLTDAGLRAAATQAAADLPAGPEVLLHGDYQHFNVLWQDGRLTGVVDWPNASTGARGSDVGHCRLNLALLFDSATADDYLARYERVAGVQVDPRADVRALLAFDLQWQRTVPRQVAGRVPVDVGGMPARVSATIRQALDRLG